MQHFPRLKNADITALEVDCVCFAVLKREVKKLGELLGENGSTVIPVNRDSRDELAGDFDFIVSSFADHHIHPLDKPQYFKNIRRNLRKHGRFIVGDEFLPEHERKDDAARREALRLYHGYIIELARKENKSELIKLEADALESGLTNKGDYKLCRSHYNDLLREAGFTIQNRIGIGPPDQATFEQVGGIFVYVLV